MIYLRNGDELTLDLPDGQKVKISYDEVDQHSFPQLEILLPQTMTVNARLENEIEAVVCEAKQIVIPVIPKRHHMTRLDFIVVCGKYLIDPAIALENEKIVKALKAKDDAEVEKLLREEF